jgi:hypothetical protein
MLRMNEYFLAMFLRSCHVIVSSYSDRAKYCDRWLGELRLAKNNALVKMPGRKPGQDRYAEF